jgi:hypothetical protein
MTPLASRTTPRCAAVTRRTVVHSNADHRAHQPQRVTTQPAAGDDCPTHTWFRIITLAPCSTSSLTIARFPVLTAQCSAERPCCSRRKAERRQCHTTTRRSKRKHRSTTVRADRLARSDRGARAASLIDGRDDSAMPRSDSSSDVDERRDTAASIDESGVSPSRTGTRSRCPDATAASTAVRPCCNTTQRAATTQ